MIREMVMPQLGMGMSEGTIVKWMVTEGDRIARDQELLSVETEKVVTELPSPYAGFVHILVSEGATVPVETLIAQIAETQEGYRKLVSAESLAPASASPVRIKASGLARKLARENGINLAGVRGSGPAGRIVRRDLTALLDPVAAPPAAASSLKQKQPLGIREMARMPLTGMRSTIAERMTKSKSVAPHTHIFFEIDVTRLVAMRQMLREREQDIGARVSMTAIYARALALACRQAPICNAALIDGEIILWDEVNIAIGVALPGRGEYDSALVAPVLRNAESKGLLQIDSEIRALVAKARAGTLNSQDVANATITMSSSEKLNNGGWLVGTPLLSLPQVVAFGPGAPVRRPVLRDDGEVVAGSILPCCITFDHRALDGAPAAKLARQLTDLLGHPELMLL
jgi:pyruvate/2-oxoglutarate dehydrogenase complex dihydrolipoamide acyltransferase (E2) component